jgi:hypothetical protein
MRIEAFSAAPWGLARRPLLSIGPRRVATRCQTLRQQMLQTRLHHTQIPVCHDQEALSARPDG